MKRVVVTGMSGITSLGETAEQIFEQFAQGKAAFAICGLGNLF